MDLEEEPDLAVRLVREAQERLSRTVSVLDDTTVRSPSALPGWTVGHVVTHLARNADGHRRRLDGALRGEDVPRYRPGQRDEEITSGAHRSAAELVDDLTTSQTRLLDTLEQCVSAGWPHGHLMARDHYPVTACPAHRLREVEMHHVDLGLQYSPADWPEEYVVWDLTVLLATVPQRMTNLADRQRLTAWLAGRGTVDGGVVLDPW